MKCTDPICKECTGKFCNKCIPGYTKSDDGECIKCKAINCIPWTSNYKCIEFLSCYDHNLSSGSSTNGDNNLCTKCEDI